VTGLWAIESKDVASSKEHSKVALKLYSVVKFSAFASTFDDSPR
jgi:hypothetical protein